MTGEQIIEQWAAHPDHPVTISTAERASVVEGWHENDRLYGQVLADCEERDDKIQQLQIKVDFLEQQLAGLQAHHESDHAKHKEEMEKEQIYHMRFVLRNGLKIFNLQEEIAALTPDATAWRDRQARFESEKQEMQGRIDKCRNQ
jgi:chromosome segregation ATPase